ncbi:MAG: hypothetical protein C5B53_11390 [Candidatus Melainabacteria bacterium]|nr:MAG: hypothetical protein C5B53_11390 [Candidatus Melainabacteria bacterium]
MASTYQGSDRPLQDQTERHNWFWVVVAAIVALGIIWAVNANQNMYTRDTNAPARNDMNNNTGTSNIAPNTNSSVPKAPTESPVR